eukprot:8221801-Alexandrium_andersonii.AAC.1
MRQVRPGTHRAALHTRSLKYITACNMCAAIAAALAPDAQPAVKHQHTAHTTHIAQPACGKNSIALPMQRATAQTA